MTSRGIGSPTQHLSDEMRGDDGAPGLIVLPSWCCTSRDCPQLARLHLGRQRVRVPQSLRNTLVLQRLRIKKVVTAYHWLILYWAWRLAGGRNAKGKQARMAGRRP